MERNNLINFELECTWLDTFAGLSSLFGSTGHYVDPMNLDLFMLLSKQILSLPSFFAWYMSLSTR